MLYYYANCGDIHTYMDSFWWDQGPWNWGSSSLCTLITYPFPWVSYTTSCFCCKKHQIFISIYLLWGFLWVLLYYFDKNDPLFFHLIECSYIYKKGKLVRINEILLKKFCFLKYCKWKIHSPYKNILHFRKHITIRLQRDANNWVK